MVISNLMEKVITLTRKHGFVYPVECLINNKTVTCYSYGLLGARIRKNLSNEWWRSMLVKNADIYAVESSQYAQSQTPHKSSKTIKSRNCCMRPSLNKDLLGHYLATLTELRQRLPFGVASEGSCLHTDSKRTEQGCFLFSSMESHHLTMHYYTSPNTAIDALYAWQGRRLRWWKKFAGVASDFSAVDIHDATNALHQIHIRYAFPWGDDTIEVLHNHADTPLVQMQLDSGVSHQGKHASKLVLPHLIECRTTIEQGMLAYLLDAYYERGHSDKQTNIMKLHARLAPYQVAIVCSANKSASHLQEVADHVTNELRHAGITALDLHNTSTAAETQFSLFDEMGIPWTVILQQSTLVNGLVLLRNRDTTIKEKISIIHLTEKMRMFNLA